MTAYQVELLIKALESNNHKLDEMINLLKESLIIIKENNEDNMMDTGVSKRKYTKHSRTML